MGDVHKISPYAWVERWVKTVPIEPISFPTVKRKSNRRAGRLVSLGGTKLFLSGIVQGGIAEQAPTVMDFDDITITT